MSRHPASASDGRPDGRLAVAPAVLVTLAGGLQLADRTFAGTALTAVRIVLILALVAATAWCGSLFRGRSTGQDGG